MRNIGIPFSFLILLLWVSCSGPDRQPAVSPSDIAVCDTLFERGQYFYDHNIYDSALGCYDSALALARKAGDEGRQARSLERLGSVHLTTDDPGLAFKLFMNSLALFEKVHDSSGIAKVYNILGIYYTSRNEDSAFHYLEKAISINEGLKDQRGIVQNKGNLAWLYQQHGKADKALALNRELVDMLEAKNDSADLPVIYYNIAAHYQEQNEPGEALAWLTRSIRICEKTRDSALLSTLFGNSGELLLGMGKRDSARMLMEKAIQCTRMTGDLETEYQAYGFLCRIDSALGHFPQVMRHYARMQVLQDSIVARQLRNNLQNSLLEYDNQQKDNRLQIQTLELRNHRQERNFFILLLMLAVVSGMLVSVYLYYRRKQSEKIHEYQEMELIIHKLELEHTRKNEELNQLKIKQIEAEKAVKEQELLSAGLQIDQKNELLKSLQQRLKSGIKDEQQGTALLSELEGLLSKTHRDSRDFDLFNEQFTALHAAFFSVLKAKHPDLTKTELRFCAYLRVNLSSAQIAMIMHITQEGIRKTRYRIRKKLGLKPEESLENYISSF